MLSVGRSLLLENTQKRAIDFYTLDRALKRRGMALICAMVNCPNCNENIWIEVGSHSGFSGTLYDDSKDMCYECLKEYEIAFDSSKHKDAAFFNIDEFNEFRYKKILMNYKKM